MPKSKYVIVTRMGQPRRILRTIWQYNQRKKAERKAERERLKQDAETL